MSTKIDKHKVVGRSLMKGVGHIQQIRLACAKTMQKDQNTGRPGMPDQPAGNGNPVLCCKGKRFPCQSVIARGRRRTVARLPDDPEGAHNCPKQTEEGERQENLQ